MKKEARKLNLNRETLAPMQQEELTNINGGITPATVTTSSMACVSAASAVGSAIIHTVSMAFESRWCGKK
jgi:lactobin A/cerein 7B family class IIb bacteriocin